MPASASLRRIPQATLALLIAASGLLAVTTSAGALPQPDFVADTAAEYALCGRVFSDPHAYWPSPVQGPERSPFAKGNVDCAANDFLTYDQDKAGINGMKQGVEFLEELFPQFVEFQQLEEDFGTGQDCETATNPEHMCSAGLPRNGAQGRVREDLYLLRVTDERVPDTNKKFFVFPLSIHGIERAGAEAGTRAAEDLATWAYCEAVANGEAVTDPVAGVNCDQEAPIPHPILETQPDASVSAGQALKDSVIYFMYANPDGWRRGDPDNGVRFFQRYNGNGVDMNRDWPTIGFTFRPYTPWSEPETRSFGQVLKEIRPVWDGGIDLHGQLVDRAFSFTLLGASQRDFGKNQRIMQTVEGAWADAEKRFEWSPAIKPNDAPEDDPRMYGVQYGTVWDTIDYTVTGSLGDWIDSPLGLGADGIDNEMSLSHLSNCGVGSCYIQDAEQLHVDGNKSLIYAMVNYTLLPEDNQFRAPGKVGYVFDPRRLQNDGNPVGENPYAGLPTQASIDDCALTAPDFTCEFTVQGPGSTPPVYNGGVTATETAIVNLGAVAPSSTTSLVLERLRPAEENPEDFEDEGCGAQGDDWEEVNRYFNQSSIYVQAGQAVHGNFPRPGLWRVCRTGGLATATIGSSVVDITFQGEQAWEDPGQLPYDVSNMDFFTELSPYMRKDQLQRVRVNRILRGKVDLSKFKSVVIADNALPGFTEPLETGPAQEGMTIANPGAGTAPCAYPTNPVLPPSCHRDHAFEVLADPNNQQLVVTLTSPDTGENDWDLYVQRQSKLTGEWADVGQSTTPTGNEQVTIHTPPAGNYRARVVNWAGTVTEDLEIAFSNEYGGPPRDESTRSQAQANKWGKILREYARQGGNLVLTDGAIRNVAYMGLVDRELVNTFSVYAGFIGFTRDGETSTYDDPLAQQVQRPGAAEGPQHRHQTFEPVPIGFAIQNEEGADFNSSPVWSVDLFEWERAGGRTVGITTPDQVTLGELPVGRGQVRIIGPVLPRPTEQYYHPFGLASHAVTYTGYQVLNNALQVPAVGGDICDRLASMQNSPFNVIVGTGGRDKLFGTPGRDAICGRGGKDKIRGKAGHDILVGGPGNDRLIGAGGRDRLQAGKGNDKLNGGVGKDKVVGYKGNDRLRGGGGKDFLNGMGGRDSCHGGGGRNRYKGCEVRKR